MLRPIEPVTQLSPKLHFCVAMLILAVASASGCKSRYFADSSSIDTPEVPLAPNDISFLYPPLSGHDLPRKADASLAPASKERVYFRPAPLPADSYGRVTITNHMYSTSNRYLWESAGGSIAAFEVTEANPTDRTTGPNFPALFDASVYKQIRAAITQEDDVTKMKFPFFFDWTVKLANTSFEKTDVLAPWRWRVVSWRYDPCPTVLHGAIRDQENPTACSPQIRIVAQPLIGLNDLEAHIAQSLPDTAKERRDSQYGNAPSLGAVYGDYAFHFFLKVTDQLGLEKQLQALKQRHQQTCATDPNVLSIHPCLWYQFENVSAQGAKINFAQELRALLFMFKGPLIHVAAMTSKRNNTPWKFMLLNPDTQSGALKPATQIALDPRILPSGSGLASAGKELVFFRSMAGTQKIPDPTEKDFESDDAYLEALEKISDANRRIEEGMDQKSRLGARVKPSFDSLDIFLRTAMGFQNAQTYPRILANSGTNPPSELPGMANITVTGSRMRDLFAMTDRIENPDVNNEFTTDCASCHMSLTEKQHSIWWTVKPTQRIKGFDPANVSVIDDETVKFGRGPFVASNEGYRYSAGSRINDMYVTNQFSYYRASPMISRRVANETARALSLLVTVGMRPPSRGASCNPRRFDFCMTKNTQFKPTMNSPKFLQDYFPMPTVTFAQCLAESKCQ